MVETDGYQEISRQEYERKTRNWEYKFCFIPHQCLETGKWLWLKMHIVVRKGVDMIWLFLLSTSGWLKINLLN